MKSLWLPIVAMACVVPGIVGGAKADERREEWREHPRIVKAVQELEDAIKYMEAAPSDFGGHKAAALASSREAVRQLRAAIGYRVGAEERHDR
jgi:hypothetical protein